MDAESVPLIGDSMDPHSNIVSRSISQIGLATHHGLEEIGSLVGMVHQTFSEIFERISLHRFPLRRDHFFEQCNRAGVGSIPMSILLSLFVGLTMALLTGYQLQLFGLVTLVPAVVSVSFTREMGPLFTGIVLASRIGASYTAELGAMTAGGEVDAIEGMGIGAHRFLVLPRLDLTLPDDGSGRLARLARRRMEKATLSPDSFSRAVGPQRPLDSALFRTSPTWTRLRRNTSPDVSISDHDPCFLESR